MVEIKEVKELASSYSLLLVEDDKDIAQTFITYLSKIFKEVVYAENGQDGLDLYKQNEYDIVMTDINMPIMNGLDMTFEIKQLNPNQNIIIVSAYTELELFISSIKLGIDGYIIKPVNYKDMNNLLFKLLTKIKKYEENDLNADQLKKMIKQISKRNDELTQYTEMLDKVAVVSKSDTKGYITYVNDVFCEVSGYTREELIGKNHNIIRHPDTPKAIFQNLWETIKSGKTWQGSIKNRAKNTEPYFVYATIIPLYDESHENIVEYIGIRFVTTKEENEKREFQKKVMIEYTEFRKANAQANKEVELLKQELASTQNEWNTYTEVMKKLKEKNIKLLSQTKFYEDAIIKNKESRHKSIESGVTNIKTINESYKKALVKIDLQAKELEFLKENDTLRKSDILKLEEKLIEQRHIIKGLNDTIKHIDEKNKNKKEEKKHFWDK